MTEANYRRNLWIQPELWERIKRAAATETAERGQTVSMSEWIRQAIEQRLEGEK